MGSFFKVFFASLLALVIFSLIVLFFGVAVIGNIASKDKVKVEPKSVLTLDLGALFHEHVQPSPLAALSDEGDVPALYEVQRLLDYAKTDKDIAGIVIKADGNANGFASSNELRNSLLDFRKSGKFVIAQGDVMSQQAYFIANAADKVYVNPSGALDWRGFSVAFPFVKGMLEKLEVETQIFYAGKYKSATEIFRTDKMTPENKLQTNEWLGDMYGYFLEQTASARKLDTASLHQLANNFSVQTPQDAVKYGLIDGLKYDDEVKDEIKKRLGIGKYDKLNYVTINKYKEAVTIRKGGSDRIAVIYAEGDIVDGAGSNTNIGGDNYRNMIRKVRLDPSVKAIVLRVNSGGGSALASDNIWRELQLARKDGKPIVVSFGDVAASGGYYISCGADSIFASPNTITGSIGVFGIIPNMSNFFRNKLGITFDGVTTAPNADAGAIYRPLTETEKAFFQNGVERTYLQFKQRVAQGRKKDIAYVDSIAQGRVWSGSDALRIGLVDRMGNLQDAINCAGRLAKLSSFGLKEYPEAPGFLDNLLGRHKTEPAVMLREQLGEQQFRVYQQLLKVQEMTKGYQARMPFEIIIQ
ncbi:MAG TPA: signal peptide peptidase SppA [Flavisolibacter sp.]|jgi:protease-4|nr:signal peptide peptidase SppA [Flavisolibacter sp.]